MLVSLVMTSLTAIGQTSYASGTFSVTGNLIRDPQGNRFVIRGVDAVYGRFAGGDSTGYGLTNYTNASRDLGNIKAAGYNLVRIDADADQWAGSTQTPSGSQFLSELENAVSIAESDGLVVEISQESSGTATDNTNASNLLALLAARYSSDPNVWLKLQNEPFCGKAVCSDWATWQSQENALVSTVRSNGYANPIVVNCVYWSWNCSSYPSYKLNDSNIILGAHRYANGDTNFATQDQSDVVASWGSLTASGYAVMMDEFGNYDTGASPPSGSSTWNAGFISWIDAWSEASGGSGAIAFADYWSDPNTMTNSDGSWNSWGAQFTQQCVAALLAALGNPTSTPTPTATATPSASPTPTPTSTPSPTATATATPTATSTPTPTPTTAPTPSPSPKTSMSAAPLQLGSLDEEYATSTRPSLPAPSTKGTLLVASVAANGKAGFTAPSGWLRAASATNVTSVQIWYYPNNPGGITSATFKTRGTDATAGQLSEWTGVAASAPLDTTRTAKGWNSNSMSISTSQPASMNGEVAIATFAPFLQGGGAVTGSPGTGWTQDATDGTNDWFHVMFDHLLTAAPGTVADTELTSPPMSSWAVAIATFKPAG